ncbi:MAG: DUF6795 domain-containing protein [Burkholderiaceae bacterium]
MSLQVVGWTLGGLAAALAVLCATPLVKVVLWSPMRGRVPIDDKPAAGAVLMRSYEWNWGNKQGGDRVVADAAGAFIFPAIRGRMLLGQVLPHEPVVEQYMSIEYQGKTHDAWAFFKRDYDIDSEIGGRPIDVRRPFSVAS